MRRSSLFPIACMCTAALSACSEDHVLCAPLFPAAVAVAVRDSVTAALLVDSAKGVVIGLGRTDTMVRGPALQFGDSVLIGGTQVGPVNVQVERPGFQPWLRTGVQTRLSGGQCPNYITRVLPARMQR